LGSLPLAATAAALLLLIAITLTLAATIAALTLTLVATALAAWGTPLTATAVATTAAAVVATATASTSVAAASVAAATAAAATTSSTIRCLVDADSTTIEFDVVHVLHSIVGLSIRGVTDETETPAAASVAVLDDDSLLYLAELLELRTQSGVIGVPRKTSYEELRHGDLKKH